MKQNKPLILAISIVCGLAFALYFPYNIKNKASKSPQMSVANFEQCANAGFPIAESYPRQCSANGQMFTEELGDENTPFVVKGPIPVDIYSPTADEVITSPLIVEGKAKGIWFFEAVFSMTLYDSNGNLLAQGQAQAQDEWMTEDFVPFKGELTFGKPTTATGKLYLYKANPSGLPENDSSFQIPVKFE